MDLLRPSELAPFPERWAQSLANAAPPARVRGSPSFFSVGSISIRFESCNSTEQVTTKVAGVSVGGVTILRNRSPLGSFKNPLYFGTMNTERLQRLAQHPRLPPHQKRPRATPRLGIHPRVGPRMGTGDKGNVERAPSASIAFTSLRWAFSPRAPTVQGGELPSSRHPPTNLFPDRERQTQTHTLRPEHRGQSGQFRKHPCRRW